MKKFFPLLLLITTASVVLQSCVKDKLQTTYTYYVPAYKSKAEVLQNIKSSAPQALQETGKLFLFGKYIFINEVNKGVHIIDNADPRSPKNIAFINIPGNLDLAVKDNTLYADLYRDMVTIDITNPAAVVVKKVISNVFPERDYGTGFTPDSTKYIVDWVRQQTKSKHDLDTKSTTFPGVIYFDPTFSASNSSTAAAGAVTGVSGSMARFTIINNYLYTVGRFALTPFNISSANEPVMAAAQSLAWSIETIYPLKDKLFIGTQNGMLIYSVTDPSNPSYLGNFNHACYRDPVIADDQYAYITLRSTNQSSCWNGTAAQHNELDIVNIENIIQPSLVKIYDMTEPKGLSKDGDHLFICDGSAGLKVFDVSNVLSIKPIKIIDDINPSDIICQGGLAIVVANTGIYQYDYTDINNIKLLSQYTINKL